MTDHVDDFAQLLPTLESLGWTADLDQWKAQWPTPAVAGRIGQVSRGYSLVFVGGDAVLAASSSQRTSGGLAPATGDFVLVEDDEQAGPVVAAIARRRSALARRASGRFPESQVLAANIDTVLIMHGLDRPINLRRLERELVVAADSGAQPVVVLTKADLLSPADPGGSGDRDASGRDASDQETSVLVEGIDAIDAVRQALPQFPVITVSTVTGDGLGHLEPFLQPGATVALFGASGVGKSSLVNALSGGVVQRIGEVRASDQRGRHTTVTRDLIPLPSGALIVDTPGIREIGLWQAYDGLAQTFPEIRQASEQCGFRDCSHEHEPGCEVLAAVADGRVAERRLGHYRQLTAELELQEEQLAEAERIAESHQRADAEDRQDKMRPNRRARRGGRRKRR